MVRLAHRPDRFWDKMADRYSKRPVADQDSYEKKLQVTREYLRPDMEVLEFGCGTGSTAIAHAPHVKHILAIDVSSNMLAIAQAKADARNVENITFRQTDIDELRAPDRSFDVVMGHSILHLVEDKDAIIVKVHRLLRPGGFFVSSTACLGDSMRYLRPIAPIGRLFGLVLNIFTRRSLLDSLTTAGFAIEHEWQPGKGKAVFIVAEKPGADDSSSIGRIS